MRIAIVDDDENRREGLKSYLVDMGIASSSDIRIASCVASAKELLLTFYFDVLILDIVLPRRDNEAPDQSHGLNLLSQLSRTSRYKKPEKIIGLTAHLEDIKQFKDEFDKYCFSVVEANRTSIGWKKKLADVIKYTVSSKYSRAVENNASQILTIHGIRTFGDWQLRFKRLVESETPNVPFHNYNYGYFSTIALLIPYVRELEVRRLARHLVTLFDRDPDARFIIFSHSFGTFLVAKALQRLISSGRIVPVQKFVLSGSVLPENYRWDYLQRHGICVVNDCADRDYILWFSKMFVIGTGMAGKSGFYGFQNSLGVNRYFLGGHSSYFNGDEFMRAHWLPLLDSSREVCPIDSRRVSVFRHGFLDKLVKAIGAIKILGYAGIISFGLVKGIFILHAFIENSN